MRKPICAVLILTLILLLTGCQPAPQPPTEEEAAALASRFILALAEEDYNEAFSQFDTQMAAAISEGQLAEIWTQLQAQAGPYVRSVEQRQELQPPYRIVIVTIQMGSFYLDTRLVYNAQQQIAGLFFQPSDYLARFYEAPPYADETLFSEYELLVGSGEWALPATLTIPAGEGPFPFVVLVHGSGPNDRNETLGPNRPFQDLAWGLASQGIGVLRYEKRTKEHGPKMVDMLDTLTPDEETVQDAVAAVALLRETPEVHPDQIYLLGHSLGAILAPRIAMQSGNLAGLILLAGTPRPLEDLVLEQVTYLLNTKENITDSDRAELAKLAEQVSRVKDPNLTMDVPAADLPLGMAASYWLYLKDYNAAAEAQAAQIPLLILQGERDYQVTMVDFQAWQEALAGYMKVTYRSYETLNHLFIAGEGTPHPDEYMTPGNVAEKVIEDIAAWIRTGREGGQDE
jgi:uncharacterized protein